jgi:aryl-alcohol dehydrogenase-like predicted oxidoreductase
LNAIDIRNTPTVSRICFDAKGIAGFVESEPRSAIRLVRDAYNLGIRRFDLGALSLSAATVIADALKPVRESVLVAGELPLAEDSSALSDFVAPFLRLTGLGRLDLAFISERQHDVASFAEQLGTLISAGIVGRVGCYPKSIRFLRQTSIRESLGAIKIIHSIWNARGNKRIIEYAEGRGISIIVVNPTGLPSSSSQIRPEAQTIFKSGADIEQKGVVPHALLDLARHKHVSPTQILIAWVLNRHRRMIPAIQASAMSALFDQIESGTLAFSVDDIQVLSAIEAKAPPIRSERFMPSQRLEAI